MEQRETTEVVVEKPSLFGMIMNPRIQFERIRENPKFLVALLIVTLLTTIGTLMMINGADLIGDDPELMAMSEEELLFITMVVQTTAIIGGLLSPIIMILISTIIFIIVAKIVRSEVSFKQLFSMNTYIFIISSFSMILNGLIFFILQTGDSETLFTSLNSVIGAEGVLGAFLGTIEVFSIWTLIITAIGLQVVAKFSKGLSWAVVIGFYIVTLVFTLVATAAGSAFGV